MTVEGYSYLKQQWIAVKLLMVMIIYERCKCIQTSGAGLHNLI